jgi:predicted permease
MISWFDIKKSFLVLTKDYKYSLVVIFSLALSLGVTLFLFEQIYTIKHKPLEFEQPEKVVSITRHENGWGYTTGGIYYFEFIYYSTRQSSFEQLARYEDRLATLQTEQFSEWVHGAAVNAELFGVAAGVNPVLGRTLVADDNIHGSPQVAVISYELWQRLFGGASAVLGQRVTLNGLVYSIVGVMPQGFRFPVNHDVWVNYPLWEMPEASTAGWNTMIGRLKEGVTLDQARSEMQSLAAQLRSEYPDQFKGKDLQVVAYNDSFSAPMTTSLRIMTIVGIAILLMGCFSVANLLIVRMLENQRESVIKSALGLPQWRIAAKPLLESLWMCLLAGVLAILLCYAFIKVAGSFMYSDGPYWWTLQFSPLIFALASGFVLLMWVVTGLVPVFMATRAPSNSALSSGRKGGVSGRSGPIMNALIGIQIICAFVLMVMTGLSVEALMRTLNADYGVNVDDIYVADVRLSEFSHPTMEDRINYYETLKQELEKIPEARHAAFMSALPGFAGNAVTYRPPDSLAVAGESFDKVFQIAVSENAFETLGIKLLRGRNFNRQDTESASPVGIVDERTAHMLDAHGDVLGKRFQIDLENKGPLITVVGVVSTVMHGSPMVEQSTVFGDLYRPMRQLLPPWGTMTAIVASESAELPAEIKSAGRRVNPQIAIAEIMTYQDRLAQNVRQILSMVYNFLPSALLAFLMASLGIYGISTRVTMQKANDLGVMKAIGASDSDVLRGFLKKTWILLGASLAAGMGALMFSLPLVTSGSFVFTTATLIVIVLSVIALIFSMVTIASVIPVSRINRLSPQAALNYQIGA